MSLLPAEVQGALQQLLQALSSTDNTIRSQAEEQLNSDWTANRADVLLMGLAEQIQNAQDTQVGHYPEVGGAEALISLVAVFCCSALPKTSL